MGQSRNKILAFAMLGGAVLIGAADAPTGGDPRVRAFVISNLYFAGAAEAGTCPVPSDGGLDIFYKMLPAAEQAQYATPEKRQALEKAMTAHFGFRRIGLRQRTGGGRAEAAVFPADFKPGTVPTAEEALAIGALNGFPKGRGRTAFMGQTIDYSSCTDPGDFPALATGLQPYDGRVAVGMNLDGKVDRRDFTSPAGEAGVDNELWRVLACNRVFREQGDPKTARGIFMSARAPTLIEIGGIDDIRNDAEVTVTVHAGVDPVTRDGRGAALGWASFRVDPGQKTTVAGRIVDGVLLTDPVDLRLNYKEQIIDAPRVIRAARIRAVLGADGSAEGEINGYYTLASFYASIEQMTQNGANLSGISCPAVRQAIDRHADGFKDSRTGRYTAISTGMGFFAAPAFIVDSPPTAVAQGTSR